MPPLCTGVVCCKARWDMLSFGPVVNRIWPHRLKRYVTVIRSSVAAGFGRHAMPPPICNPFWPFHLETGVRVTSKVGNLRSKFGHARPVGSRIICYVLDGRTDGWTKATLISPCPMVGGITSVGRLWEPRVSLPPLAWGVSFSWGRKHLGHPWCGQSSSNVAAHASQQQHTFQATDKQTNR